ncbi:MAG: hypothetical protein MJ209_06285 [archaeon]|nr:hypothetical protein [archaeon]
MDVNSAVQLLDKTFHNSFDLNNFEEFLVELFNTPVMEFKDNTAFIKNGYKKYVNKLLSLGSYRMILEMLLDFML